MSKSKILQHKLKKVYQRDNHVNLFINDDNITIIENINKIFIDQIREKFLNFLNVNIELLSYSIKIKSNNNDHIDNFMYSSLIEVSPFKNQCLIVFSENFLSVIINILFGGNNYYQGKIIDKNNITSTEYYINKKIINLIIESYSYACKKFFLIEMKFINMQIFIDFKKNIFYTNKKLLINSFNLNINNIKVSFNLFIPLLMVKQFNKNINSLLNKKKVNFKKNLLNFISLNDIYDVELNVITELINPYISYNQLDNLSIGDILPINKPDKTISYINNKPIFFGHYKTFNQQSIIFVESFINNNSESGKK